MAMRILSALIFILTTYLSAHSQFYDDYVGAGHDQGIAVTTSDSHEQFGWNIAAEAQNTINGHGMDAAYMEASRFLYQASLGATEEDVEMVVEMGIEDWIDAQVELPYESQYDKMYAIIEEAIEVYVANGGNAEDYFSPGFQHVQYAWWNTVMTGEDLLRQRVGQALSEVVVVSLNSNLEETMESVPAFHDVILRNSFGNYRDLLEEVTYHPTMGVYLSHYNNPLEIDSLNIHPDENYAREIMQLFSIGLYELNMDGTEVQDGQGNPVATYDLDDIKGLAAVFTGLGPGAVIDNPYGVDEPSFGMTRYLCDFNEPMVVYPEWHQQGAKHIIGDYTIAAGQTAEQEIDEALDVIFNHANVPPFMARRLIQQLVKSNPTPAYIQRVAEVFADNGDGERGDLLATIKAVLLDEEARSCEWSEHPEQGKLLPPLYRYSQFARHVDKVSEDDRFWNTGYEFYQQTENGPFTSATVFNYYLPDFVPAGPIADAGLFGPEYQIHNSKTSLGYVNMVNSWAINWALMYPWDEVSPVFISSYNVEELAREPEILVNYMDKHYCRGQMTVAFRQNMKEALEGFTLGTAGGSYLYYRARMAYYMLLISPDYVVLK